MLICNASWLPTPPTDTAAWWFFTAVIAAAVVMGIAKSGFGGGVAILCVPLIANAMPPERALGVMLPIMIVADVFAVYQHRGKCSWALMRPAMLGAAIGIGLGTVIYFLLQSNSKESIAMMLSIMVGTICLLMVGLQVYRLCGGKVPTLPGNRRTGIAVGATAGFTSMLAHAAGPIMSIYWLEQRLDKRVLTSSLVLFFIMVNTAKVPSYVKLEMITTATLCDSAFFALFVPIGSLLGIVMHHRIPEKPFTAVMYAGAAIAGGWLILKVMV